MSVKSNLERAEEALRKALINALAEGEDQYLTELFEMLKMMKDLKAKINNTIRFTDKIEQYYNRETEFNLDYNVDNIIEFPSSGRHGGDLDALDDIKITTDDSPETT